MRFAVIVVVGLITIAVLTIFIAMVFGVSDDERFGGCDTNGDVSAMMFLLDIQKANYTGPADIIVRMSGEGCIYVEAFRNGTLITGQPLFLGGSSVLGMQFDTINIPPAGNSSTTLIKIYERRGQVSTFEVGESYAFLHDEYPAYSAVQINDTLRGTRVFIWDNRTGVPSHSRFDVPLFTESGNYSRNFVVVDRWRQNISVVSFMPLSVDGIFDFYGVYDNYNYWAFQYAAVLNRTWVMDQYANPTIV